ncbi:hypothetical protein BJY16_001458 [Actinoplanes octamycinicus]|uniref:DUF4352 domain-containing protein n=1 Tax=Actinoplanes octamycinicus TaxID=135948 RepID=A0A7W7GTF8_9ACTN|nr:DUF4352 domain-containing protein [Actinoplanes octamycinicus]MBB4737999.1 hypothetical protein [Actinoplanes octamycinicus]GIE58951.1 hypothetical protein Aoc01nite_43530 [Actinoplanes octamycinicus]
MTYTPHRATTIRVLDPDDDGVDEWALRWRARIWVGGGVFVALALITFGIWAVATADRPAGGPAVIRGLPAAGPADAAPGGFGMRVRNVRCGVSAIGPDGLEQRAAGQFCLLDVRVTNNGLEPELFDSAAQRVYDTNGAAYAVADEAAVFLNDDSPTLLDEIEPGSSVNGVLPFDVPKNAQLSEVSLNGSSATPGIRMSLPTAD